MTSERFNSSHQISLDDFSMLKLIGAGSYSKVMLVRWLKVDRLYALKMIKKSKAREMTQKEHVFT